MCEKSSLRKRPVLFVPLAEDGCDVVLVNVMVIMVIFIKKRVNGSVIKSEYRHVCHLTRTYFWINAYL